MSRASLLRSFGLVVTVVFGALFLAQWATWMMGDPGNIWGGDFLIYRDATARWLSGGSYYLDRQLHGPYQVQHGDVLYPPTVILVLLPFLWLPAIVWWAIPLAIVATVVVRHHPHPLAWALIAMCVWFPATGVKVIYGNPSMWITAAVALATVWRWPAAFVLLKPTLAPFALIGVHRRHWWIALASLVGVSLLFVPMWVDAIHVLVDARTSSGLLYSAYEVPMLAIPVIAWLGGRSSPLLDPRLHRRRVEQEPARTNG